MRGSRVCASRFRSVSQTNFCFCRWWNVYYVLMARIVVNDWEMKDMSVMIGDGTPVLLWSQEHQGIVVAVAEQTDRDGVGYR